MRHSPDSMQHVHAAAIDRPNFRAIEYQVHVPEGMNMAQASDGDITDNVRTFPGAGAELPPRSRRRGKDRRAAARQAKKRSKIKADRDAGPATMPPPVSPPLPAVTVAEEHGVTVSLTAPARVAAPKWGATTLPQRPAEHHRIDRLTLLAALALATVSAGFSIYGFTSIFVGAFWPVIGMGLRSSSGSFGRSPGSVATVCRQRGGSRVHSPSW